MSQSATKGRGSGLRPAKPRNPDILTPLEARFCEEYLVDLCITDAGRRAGYKDTEYLKRNVWVVFQKPRVKARIAALMAEREQVTRVKGYLVLEELATVALSNIAHYRVSEDGEVTLAPGAPPDAMRALAKVKRKTRLIPQKDGEAITEHEVEIALWDKNTALTNALKHLGMLTERHEVRLPQGSGVLAVPVPVDAEQWGAMAKAQQAALAGSGS